MLALVWLFPLLWAVINSFREYAYTQANGYLSFGGWTFDNYQQAWTQGNFGLHMKNSLLVTVPAVLLTLFLSSMVAFVLARFSYRFNLLMLGVFLAANLLPPQALLIPVFRMFREIPLPLFMSDSRLDAQQLLGADPGQHGLPDGVLHVRAEQLHEDAARTRSTSRPSSTAPACGASTGSSTMPLVRPALAALATLQFTWIYNEFFWATVLIQQGDKLPDHLGAQQPAGAVLHRHQPGRGRIDHRGAAGARRVLRAAEAVRLRADARIDQGLTQAPARIVRATCRSSSSTTRSARRPGSQRADVGPGPSTRAGAVAGRVDDVERAAGRRVRTA